MISISKKIAQLQIAVKAFEDSIAVENKLLQISKDNKAKNIETRTLISECLNQLGTKPSGVSSPTGQQLKSFADYRTKLTESLSIIDQAIVALDIEIKHKNEVLRALIAKKTAGNSVISKLNLSRLKAEDKAQQEVAELMHTVRNLNQEES